MPSKVISHKEFIRKFRKLGFGGRTRHGGGKHLFMVKGKQKIRIPNPHQSKDIHASLVREILRQASVTPEKWEKI